MGTVRTKPSPFRGCCKVYTSEMKPTMLAKLAITFNHVPMFPSPAKAIHTTSFTRVWEVLLVCTTKNTGKNHLDEEMLKLQA